MCSLFKYLTSASYTVYCIQYCIPASYIQYTVYLHHIFSIPASYIQYTCIIYTVYSEPASRTQRTLHAKWLNSEDWKKGQIIRFAIIFCAVHFICRWNPISGQTGFKSIKLSKPTCPRWMVQPLDSAQTCFLHTYFCTGRSYFASWSRKTFVNLLLHVWQEENMYFNMNFKWKFWKQRKRLQQ